MGLTAMEAMACGAAVIVPRRGGAGSFARHEENALVVDTGSIDACLAALERLTLDQALRTRLQRQSLLDACEHYPEGAAYNILNALFPASLS
jgi:glycosyltransferase involved in cell wall biosynthesis